MDGIQRVLGWSLRQVEVQWMDLRVSYLYLLQLSYRSLSQGLSPEWEQGEGKRCPALVLSHPNAPSPVTHATSISVSSTEAHVGRGMETLGKGDEANAQGFLFSLMHPSCLPEGPPHCPDFPQ
jgi:hypothetical protein